MAVAPSAASNAINVPLLARVNVPAGPGVVRFVGQTSFAAGKWVGIELDAVGTGKNDGSVQGKPYFALQKAGTLSGVFVRPSQIQIIDKVDRDEDDFKVPPLPRQPQSVASASIDQTPRRVDGGRPSLASTTAQSATNPALSVKRPAPSPRVSSVLSSRVGTPVRPSSTALGRHSSSSSVTSAASRTVSASLPETRTTTPARLPSTPRRSTERSDLHSQNVSPHADMPATPSRSSSRASTSALPTPAPRRHIPSRQSDRPSDTALPTSAPEVDIDSSRSQDTQASLSSPIFATDEALQSHTAKQANLVIQEDRSAAASKAAVVHMPQGVSLRTYEELQHKYRLLEAGRADDRERLKAMERLKEDAESWNVARPKLQTKLVELSAEVKELRKAARETAIERESDEKQLADLNDQLEMAALDKEVAEEKVEDVAQQLEQAKERCAELEVELQAIRQEDQRIVSEVAGDTGDNVKDSLAFLQLAKQNERLKEALVKLRDFSAENEQDNKRRIADLEKELDLTSDLQNAYTTTAEQLEASEAIVESLKLQLDDAMGAQDMLELLTERNLALSERVEEAHAVIQDLEALKEVSDEVEEFRAENEKQLQDEIARRDAELRVSTVRIESLEDDLLDYQGTIEQFRELVSNQQSEIEKLHQQYESQQSQSQALSSHSQAMLNLNHKLQTTVVRNNSKAIDLEMERIKADMARKQLEIVTGYLPPIFLEEDKAAVEALLFFSRLADKVALLIVCIEKTHHLESTSNPDTFPDSAVAACETRSRASRFMVLCRRFAANLDKCEPAIFLKLGQVHLEMSHMEKRIDGFIELARKEDLKIVDCGSDFDGFTAQAVFVAETHLGDNDLDMGEQQSGHLLSIYYDLATVTFAVGFVQQNLSSLLRTTETEPSDSELDPHEAIFSPLSSILTTVAAIKVNARRLHQHVQQTVDGGGFLTDEITQSLLPNVGSARSLTVFAGKFAELIGRYVLELRTTHDSFDPNIYLGITQEAALDIRSQSKDLLGVEIILRNLKQSLAALSTAALQPENHIKISYQHPWQARVQHLQNAVMRDMDADRLVLKMTEDIKDLARELRLKDQALQESHVKIDTIELRMEGFKRQADLSTELDIELSRLKKLEQDSSATIRQLQTDLDTVHRDLATAKQAITTSDKDLTVSRRNAATDLTLYTGSLETGHLLEQIAALRGTVQYLRRQNTMRSLPSAPESTNVAVNPDLALPDYESLMANDATFATGAQRLQRHRIRTETAALAREAATLSASARVVELAVPSKQPNDNLWQPALRKPAGQLAAKRAALVQLRAKVTRLADEQRVLTGRL